MLLNHANSSWPRCPDRSETILHIGCPCAHHTEMVTHITGRLTRVDFHLNADLFLTDIQVGDNGDAASARFMVSSPEGQASGREYRREFWVMVGSGCFLQRGEEVTENDGKHFLTETKTLGERIASSICSTKRLHVRGRNSLSVVDLQSIQYLL